MHDREKARIKRATAAENVARGGSKDRAVQILEKLPAIKSMPSPSTRAGGLDTRSKISPTHLMRLAESHEYAIRDIFSAFDYDCNGLLDEYELRELLRVTRYRCHDISKETRDADEKLIETIDVMAGNYRHGVDFTQFAYIYNEVLDIGKRLHMDSAEVATLSSYPPSKSFQNE